MAYKDEYEGRTPSTRTANFETTDPASSSTATTRLKFHLFPTRWLARKKTRTQVSPRKIEFRFHECCFVFRGAREAERGLRGTAFDVFGYTAERRRERALVEDYIAPAASGSYPIYQQRTTRRRSRSQSLSRRNPRIWTCSRSAPIGRG